MNINLYQPSSTLINLYQPLINPLSIKFSFPGNRILTGCANTLNFPNQFSGK
jgi:hypothetical protein